MQMNKDDIFDMEQANIGDIAIHQSETGKTKIEERIFTIRGRQVILDRDLAQLYQVEVSQMNRQVKRNQERFPDDFMFQLSKTEWDDLKCQNQEVETAHYHMLSPNMEYPCWQGFSAARLPLKRTFA